MKKIYAYPNEVSTGVIVPFSVDVMAYEEYEGDVRITMFFKDATQILAEGKEWDVWELIGYKMKSFPEYYKSFLDVIMKKLATEEQTLYPNQQAVSFWFEEALDLLNRTGKRWGVSIYFENGKWYIGSKEKGKYDLARPSFSIALKEMLEALERRMVKYYGPTKYED